MFIIKTNINDVDHYFSGFAWRHNRYEPSWAVMDEAVSVVLYETLDDAISVQESIDGDSVICTMQCSEIPVD